MNWLSVALYALAAGPSLVKAIQLEKGDTAAGKDKKAQAVDQLSNAMAGIFPMLSGKNSLYAQIAASIAADAIQAGYVASVSDGSYAMATTASPTNITSAASTTTVSATPAA